MNPVTPELQTILHHAAFAPVPERAFLQVTGSDATRWLNGMVTNSAQALAPGAGCYNFFLNAQGRIQGDCLLYREPGDSASAVFLLATETSQVPVLVSHLDRFIIMDDVELTQVHANEPSLLLLGPEAPDLLRRLDLPVPNPLRLMEVETSDGPVSLLTPAESSVPRVELRASAVVIAALREKLIAAGIAEASPEALEQLRILQGTPRFGIDIRDRELPQETAQSHALHFAKGCYLGQEIVERIRSRGQVHRTFAGFRLGGSLPTLPVALEADGKPVGELTSATEVLAEDGPALLALGYVRREALDRGATLTYPGGEAQFRPL